jgi:hypothetical protein
MNIRMFTRSWQLILAIGLCFAVILGQTLTEAAASPCDPEAPIVTITAPALGGGSYVTDQTVVNLAGNVDDTIGVTNVSWSNNRGGSGSTLGTITTWAGPWRWEANGIPLAEGDNIITVTARDAAGNIDTSTLTVTYNAPPPPPPPSTEKVLDNRKVKFTFYFGGASYNSIDRVSDVGYLLKNSSETFVMPFNKDVTVTIKVQDPRNPSTKLQVFTQTIPAGTVTGSSKYRYVTSSKGINELTFEAATSTAVYMYLFVDKVDFLPSIKAIMTSAEFQAFVKSIKQATFTVQIGTTAWNGNVPLSLGTYTDHKQELVYNR